MAEHPEAQGAVRRLQDGNELEVGSTGTLRTYGNVRLGSSSSTGSTGNIKLTAAMTVAGSGEVRVQTESVHNAASSTDGTTSFATLTRRGISELSCTGSTASSLCGFRLPAPVAGLRKTIVAKAGIDATHDAIVETTGKAVTIGHGSTKNTQLAFDAADELVVLEGVSATKWIIASNVGSVAVSTKFTT